MKTVEVHPTMSVFNSIKNKHGMIKVCVFYELFIHRAFG